MGGGQSELGSKRKPKYPKDARVRKGGARNLKRAGKYNKTAAKRERTSGNRTFDNKVKYTERRRELESRDDNVVFLNTKPKQMDLSLLIIVLMLVMFGLVMIFSSSYYIALTKYENHDSLRFIKQQAKWAGLGIVAMFFISGIDYKRIRAFTPIVYLTANVFLVLVLLFGDVRNGSKRWLTLGPIEFQPSEVAKIATILFVASYVAGNKTILKKFGGFAKCMSFVVLPVVLVAIENFSTSLVIAVVGTAILFIASPVIWYFVAMAIPAVGAMVIAVTLPTFAYRFDRIKTWYDPFADTTGLGFQTVQSLYAVASGGFFGLGLGQSRQKLGYIPEAYNDIIFSIVCEELGLFGATALILLFYALIYKGIMIALKCTDLFGTLVAGGVTCMIAVQVIINIAVNTNAIPVTGMPLPFISYGGSSLLIMMSCMGILLNISKYTRE